MPKVTFIESSGIKHDVDCLRACRNRIVDQIGNRGFQGIADVPHALDESSSVGWHSKGGFVTGHWRKVRRKS